MRQMYIEKEFRAATLNFIEVMNAIIREYQAQGFVLTVRQLYYQLVARDVIANNLREYKRTASVINDAKLAGYLDWDAIEDRTRAFVSQQRWRGGAHILAAAQTSFHMDMWEGQANRCFVIVEKEALVGVLERVCRELDMPLLAARGYPSGSVLREFAEEQLLPALTDDYQDIVIIHLGDHDPSGIDMTRDLADRLQLFCGEHRIEINRIALNMNQVEEIKPPENPAKVTDSRFDSYMRRFGRSSWELDALSPVYLDTLVRDVVEPLIDPLEWDRMEQKVEDTKRRIGDAAKQLEAE